MERNIWLDYFKIILSILVVTIHMQPLFGNYDFGGWAISNGIARIAVPCFFIISGYFIDIKLNDKKALKRYLLHIFIVYIVWSVIYIPIYYTHIINLRAFVSFFIFGYYHLWFLPGLIVGILMLAIIHRYIKNTTFILFISLALFVVGYIIEYKQLLSYHLFCNGVFFGFPFISLGYYIKKKKLEKVIPDYFLYIMVGISLTTLLIESYCSMQRDVVQNFYLSLYILCPTIILCILKRPKKRGQKYGISNISAGIYYIHILVITEIIPLNDSYNIYRLPLVVILSVLLSIFIIRINKRIKIFL